MFDYRFLALNLRLLRAEARLSQGEIAERCGGDFTQHYVSALERGQYPRAASHVEALARALKVDSSELVRRVRRRVGVAA